MLKGVLSCLVAVALAALPAQADTQIGVTAAVLPDATGTPPDANMRVLQIGVDMFASERVETGPDGKTQLLFLDGTALSVGPNSDIVLDEFVYDPEAKTGRLAMSATKGVFRLVGGAISKKTPITIKTPTATIGIRGGIALVNVSRDRVEASFLFGIGLTVTTPAGVQTIERPGTAVSVQPGQPVEVVPVGSPVLGQTLDRLEGRASSQPQQPAAQPQVQDSDIARSQIGNLASNVAPQATPAVQPQGGPADGPGGRRRLTAAGGGPGQPPRPGLFGALAELISDPLRLVDETRTLEGQQSAETVAAAAAIAPPRRGGLFVHGDPVVGEANAFEPSGVFDPMQYRPFQNAVFGDGLFGAIAGGAPIRLPLQAGEFSFSDTAVGGTLSPFGPVSGIGHAPDPSFVYYTLVATQTGQPAALFAGVPSVGQGAPLQAFTLHPAFPDDFGIPFLLDGFGGDIPTASERPLYWIFAPSEGAFAGPSTRSVWGAVAIEGNGPSQRTAVVGALAAAFFDPALGKDVFGGAAQGFARIGPMGGAIASRSGNSVVPDGNGDWSFGGKGIGTEYFVTSSDLYMNGARVPSQVTANIFDAPVVARGYQQSVGEAIPVPAAIGQQRSSRILRGYAGGLADTRDPQNPGQPTVTVPLVNSALAPGSLVLATGAATNSAFMRLDLADPLFSSGRVELFFGNVSGSASVRSGFIDDRVLVMGEAAGGDPLPGGGTVPGAGGRLLGSAPAKVDAVALTNYYWADRSAVPGGVSICTCSFMTWGFWGADIQPINAGSGASAYRTTLAGFVAGELPSLAEVPQAGTATYSGHAMANIRNAAGAQYTAFGSFQQTWNFGQRTGTATLANLDGATYQAAVSSSNGRDIAGMLNGVSAGATGRSGSYAASFFRNGSDAVGGIGGSFAIAGPDSYLAAGVVVGRR